jgi:hypothetical protein
MSRATSAFNPLGLRSFEIATSTTSAPANGTAIDPGVYEITASVDTTVMVAAGSGNITAPKLSSVTTQPAAGSPNRLHKIGAGQSKMIEIAVAGKIAAITDSGSGWLAVSGPWGKASLP